MTAGSLKIPSSLKEINSCSRKKIGRTNGNEKSLEKDTEEATGINGAKEANGLRQGASSVGTEDLEVGLGVTQEILTALRTSIHSKPGTSKSNKVGLLTKLTKLELRNLILRITKPKVIVKSPLVDNRQIDRSRKWGLRALIGNLVRPLTKKGTIEN